MASLIRSQNTPTSNWNLVRTKHGIRHYGTMHDIRRLYLSDVSSTIFHDLYLFTFWHNAINTSSTHKKYNNNNRE